MTSSPSGGPPPGCAATPWALAWEASGELTAQDRFDVLQALLATESDGVQVALVCAMERLPNQDLSVVACTEVSGLCA